MLFRSDEEEEAEEPVKEEEELESILPAGMQVKEEETPVEEKVAEPTEAVEETPAPVEEAPAPEPVMEKQEAPEPEPVAEKPEVPPAAEQILSQVREYCERFHQKKPYTPGDRIPYAGRIYDAEEMTNLVDASLEFWLTSGRYTEQFEKKLAEYLQVTYCSAVNSGSSANLLAFMALTSPLLGERRILPGDEMTITVIAAGFGGDDFDKDIDDSFSVRNRLNADTAICNALSFGNPYTPVEISGNAILSHSSSNAFCNDFR